MYVRTDNPLLYAPQRVKAAGVGGGGGHKNGNCKMQIVKW